MAKVWRCSYVAREDLVEIVNTFHYVSRAHGGALGDPSAVLVRDTLDSALTTKYRAMCMTTAQVESLTIREEVAPGSGAIPEVAVKSINLAGTRSGISKTLPKSLCLLASIKSNAAVRGGQGRMWLPPIYDSGDLTNGQWIAGLVAAGGTYDTFVSAATSDHDTSGVTDFYRLSSIVYSRTRHARGEANYYFDVTGYTLKQQPHWLRSRATAP